MRCFKHHILPQLHQFLSYAQCASFCLPKISLDEVDGVTRKKFQWRQNCWPAPRCSCNILMHLLLEFVPKQHMRCNGNIVNQFLTQNFHDTTRQGLPPQAPVENFSINILQDTKFRKPHERYLHDKTIIYELRESTELCSQSKSLGYIARSKCLAM